MNWPDDADGDVLRRLEDDSFDFSKEHTIDFIIDFNSWPLSSPDEKAIKELYPSCEFIEPDEDDIENGEANGYVQFSLTSKLTYEFVIAKQKEITDKTKQLGGWCDSWGVEH